MIKNNTSFNILASFAFTGKSPRFNAELVELASSGILNLMIDSGAFTKFTAPANFGHITLDNYCDYLEKYGGCAEKYVMLDKVGDAEQSRHNYEIMVQRGLRPMFVATMFDRDFDYIKSTLQVNKNLCVAGGVTTKGPWMIKRFQDVYRRTGEQARIHGLGYVVFPDMFRLPLASVDSSSWASGQQYGEGKIWLGAGKKKNIHWKDYLQQGKKLPAEVITALDKVCITPTMFFQEKYHRGLKGIENFLAMQCAIAYQQYSKINGRDLFLAVINAPQIRQLYWIKQQGRALKYENFINTKF